MKFERRKKKKRAFLGSPSPLSPSPSLATALFPSPSFPGLLFWVEFIGRRRGAGIFSLLFLICLFSRSPFFEQLQLVWCSVASL
jgi:hypothetical protein